MRYRFIQSNAHTFPVVRMCVVLGVSPLGYYDWRDHPLSRRAKWNAMLTEKTEQFHQMSNAT